MPQSCLAELHQRLKTEPIVLTVSHTSLTSRFSESKKRHGGLQRGNQCICTRMQRWVQSGVGAHAALGCSQSSTFHLLEQSSMKHQ